MPKTLFRTLLALAATLLFSAPVPAADPFTFGTDATQAAEHAELQAGLEQAAAGQTGEALASLRRFVQTHPDSPLLPQAYRHLARLLEEAGEPQEALLYLDRIPDRQQTAADRLRRGTTLLAAGEWEAGRALLLDLPETSLQPEERRRRLLALAEADARLDRPLAALVLLDQALKSPAGADRLEIWEQAHLLMAGLADPDLDEAAFLLRSSPLGADAVLQQARRALARGETETARGWAEALLHGSGDFPYRGEASALWQQITGRPWLRRAVGVVLPLSGRYAAFGELVRRGVELAADRQDPGAEPVRFLVRDAGADPAQTAEAVAQLIRDEGVMAVLGPLTGAAAAAAAEQAQGAGVPLLALSPREGLPAIGDFVFRNSLTNAMQVQTLVGFVMAGDGPRSFGILYPETRQGRELADLFAAEVTARGGVVTGRQGYEEAATDFRRQIRLLQGLDPSLVEPSKTEGAEPPPAPPLPFDALFIPDYAEKIGLIAPQLAYYGMEGISLLGINGWNSPDLVRLAGHYVEGAIFADGFFRNSPFPFVREFVDAISARYGEEPSILEAQGFDSAAILLSLLDRPEVRTRDGLRRALASLRNYPGLTGATSFTAGGEAEKVLYLLQVQNGDIVQIN